MKFDRDSLRQWSNLVAIITAFGANILANINPINNLSIGDISNTFFREVLIIPANYAFAIWGLIYLGLISLAIYQALPAQKNNSRLRKMGYFLAIASLAQIIWIYLFQSQLFVLSLVAMIVILLSLIALYLRLEIAIHPVSRREKWLVNFPVSIYLAWISVATIVNAASVLDNIGWNGWGISPLLWTIAMMLVATALAAIIAVWRNDLAYAGVVIWALVAIAVRHIDIFALAGTAAGLAIILILLLGIRWSRFWQVSHSNV
ncbi:MAG: tryptophan-rich sensory protein [Hydrococcus sp. Prado102]|jgi:hypothetical protein|nr:tryptophan-rich sensory protein [Hydrococcus sp. Prado102]